jgi:hypothetical protein
MYSAERQSLQTRDSNTQNGRFGGGERSGRANYR